MLTKLSTICFSLLRSNVFTATYCRAATVSASRFIRTKKATLKITSPRLRGDSLGGTRESPDQVLPYGRGGFRRGDRTLCLRTKALKTRKATLNGCQRVRSSGFYVRIKGLEPPRLSASDPKSDVATNYTISAWLGGAKI